MGTSREQLRDMQMDLAMRVRDMQMRDMHGGLEMQIPDIERFDFFRPPQIVMAEGRMTEKLRISHRLLDPRGAPDRKLLLLCGVR